MLNIVLFFSTYFSGIFAGIFYSPIFLICLYQAVYFFNPAGRWWGNSIPDVSYSFFISALLVIVFILNRSDFKNNLLHQIKPFKWMLLILVLYILTYFVSPLPELHYIGAVDFTKVIVLVFICFKMIHCTKHLHYVVWSYIAGCWYIGLQAFQVGRNSAGRVEGIGTVDAFEANTSAALIAPALVLCLFYFWKGNRTSKLLSAICGAFIANGLVLINSRGAFLAVLGAACYFMMFAYFSRVRSKRQFISIAFISVLGFSSAIYVIDDAFVERIETIFTSNVNVESENGATRIVFWKSSIDMVSDYPTGVGIRGFEYYAPTYLPKNVHTGASRNRAVHSSWFEALTEIGYLGMLALVMMVLATIRMNKETRNYLKLKGDIYSYYFVVALESSFFSFLIAATFLNRTRAVALYWLVLFCCVAHNVFVKKDINVKASS